MELSKSKKNCRRYTDNFWVLIRFRSEDDDDDKVEKWTTPEIFHMYRIFEDLDIDKVLDDEVDTRKSSISELSKKQLQHECKERGIPYDGKKVEITILHNDCV